MVLPDLADLTDLTDFIANGMTTDSRGAIVHNASSNRAGFASDASIDGAFLAAGASKTVTIVDAVMTTAAKAQLAAQDAANIGQIPRAGRNVPVCAQRLWINNDSGQLAELTFSVLHTGSQVEVSPNPLHLKPGETIEIFERVVSIREKNIGAMGQVSLGVRYYATLEPNYR